MRNTSLHEQLRGFAERAAEHLTGCVEAGSEVPYEVAEHPGATSVLYQYRPLSSEFVRARFDELRPLDGFGPAVLGLSAVEGTSAYLRALGSGDVPMAERERAETVLSVFLARLWDEVTTFELDEARFARAYRELESIVYENAVLYSIVVPVLGLRLAGERWELGSDLALVRGDLFDAPPGAVWAAGDEEREPSTLAVLSLETMPQEAPPLTHARLTFRRLLTAIRLLKAGGAGLAANGWWRAGDGPWQAVQLSFAGRQRRERLWLEPREREELRELFELVRERPAANGPLPWALARFEMGCERAFAVEGLSDHLLALRALLDGDSSTPAGLGARLAVLCAEPPKRREMESMVEQAFRVERRLMRGELHADYLEATGGEAPDAVATSLEDQLRAVLRDALFGHLERDLRRVADDLLRIETGEAEAQVARRPEEAEQHEPPARKQAGETQEHEVEQATEETVAVGGPRRAGDGDEQPDRGVDEDDDPSDYSAAV